MRTRSVTRQVTVFVGVTYVLALLIALALPHNDLASLLTIFVPVLAVAVTIPSTIGRGDRRRAWAEIGWKWPPLRVVLIALLLPAGIALASFGATVAIGVASFRISDVTLGTVLEAVRDLGASLIFGSVLILGEEIGWRGFLLPRLAALMPVKRAWLLTGAVHAVFHVPLLLLTTVYQTAGNRWIIVPMVLVTITFAGVLYGWMREIGRGVGAVAVMHNAFNTYMEQLTAAAVTSSAATLAYLTTETGLFTLLAVVAVAGWLLWRYTPATRTATASTTGASR